MIFSSDEEIEILDLDDNIETVSRVEKYKEVVEEDESKKSALKGKVKKEKKKGKDKKKKIDKPKNKLVFISQIIFCSLSLIFIIGCFIFYGGRLFKYYRIYNPKPSSNGSAITLLANTITSKSEIVYEESGLYISGGNYIYKGDVSNNYVKFNNMLWRIVRINRDDTIEIILDDYINLLNWDNENDNYKNANVYNYLNDYFLGSIDKNMLAPLNICIDKFDTLSELSCNNTINDSYVSLLDVSNFLNSVVDGKSYLVKTDEIFWLSNQGTDKVWHTNGVNVSMSDGNNFYEVRPLVTLKATTALYTGDGTKEKPYQISEEKQEINIGSYVKLGDDLWTVYNDDDYFRLSLASTLPKQYHFSYKEKTYDLQDENSLADYLNTTYLESLTYQDILKETEWYIGSFDGDYQSIKDEKVKAKVGILNLMDLKFDSSISNYLLSTTNKEGLIYTYSDVLKTGKTTIYRNIRPCIGLDKNTKIKSGKGTLNDPYVVEV